MPSKKKAQNKSQVPSRAPRYIQKTKFLNVCSGGAYFENYTLVNEIVISMKVLGHKHSDYKIILYDQNLEELTSIDANHEGRYRYKYEIPLSRVAGLIDYENAEKTIKIRLVGVYGSENNTKKYILDYNYELVIEVPRGGIQNSWYNFVINQKKHSYDFLKAAGLVFVSLMFIVYAGEGYFSQIATVLTIAFGLYLLIKSKSLSKKVLFGLFVLIMALKMYYFPYFLGLAMIKGLRFAFIFGVLSYSVQLFLQREDGIPYYYFYPWWPIAGFFIMFLFHLSGTVEGFFEGDGALLMSSSSEVFAYLIAITIMVIYGGVPKIYRSFIENKDNPEANLIRGLGIIAFLIFVIKKAFFTNKS